MLRLTLALTLALIVPACSSAPGGSVEVYGGARTEVLSGAHLAGMSQVEVEVKGARYSGPLLREVLLAGGVLPGSDIEAVAADGYRQVLSAAVVEREDVIVALGLSAPEGPLRVVVPGSPGLSVRQLVGLRAAPAAR